MRPIETDWDWEADVLRTGGEVVARLLAIENEYEYNVAFMGLSGDEARLALRALLDDQRRPEIDGLILHL